MNKKVQELITKLERDRDEGPRKLGTVPYGTGKGRRNPIRSDTGFTLTMALVMRSHPVPEVIVEYGTAYGLSTCFLWLGKPKGATIYTVEFDPETAAEAKRNFKEAEMDNIVVLPMSSEEAIGKTRLPDVVFFDHEKRMYLPDAKAIISRQGSKPLLLLADNVIDRQAECQDFLDWIKGVADSCTIIPTQCGLMTCKINSR